MPSEAHWIIYTWKEIAKYTPYAEQTLCTRFGKEMLECGAVHKGRKPGRSATRHVVWGKVWKIERFFELKAEKGEL